MTMIGDGLDVVVNVRIEVLSTLPVIDAAGDDMPKVRDHAGADQELPFRVVIDAPRVAEAVRNDLEHVLRGMVSPHAAVDVDARTRKNVLRERLLMFVETSLPLRFPDF